MMCGHKVVIGMRGSTSVSIREGRDKLVYRAEVLGAWRLVEKR